jgi:hypothetical protein
MTIISRDDACEMTHDELQSVAGGWTVALRPLNPQPSQSQLLAATSQMQGTQNSFDMLYLELQNQMQT